MVLSPTIDSIFRASDFSFKKIDFPFHALVNSVLFRFSVIFRLLTKIQ